MVSKVWKSRLASMSVMTAVIGSVIVGIALLAVGYKVVVGSDEINDEQRCHLSILAADQAASIREDTADIFDIVPNLECEPREIELNLDRVTRGRSDVIDDDLVKGVIARELEACWSKVGAGTMNPFEGFWPDFDKTFCMTCTEVSFGEDFRERAQQQRYELQGVKYWLATRFVPGKDYSFYEFMFKKRPSTQEIEAMRNAPDSWDLEKEYVIIWRFEKAGSMRILAGALAAIGVGLVSLNPIASFVAYTVVTGVGEDRISQGVYMVPRDTLAGKMQIGDSGEPKDTCTILVN